MTETLTIDSETYVQRGISEAGLTTQQWADKFNTLGGTACIVTRSRQHGKMNVRVEGTADAIAYVRACCEA